MKPLIAVFALMASLASPAALAGQSCDTHAPTPTQVREALELAEQAREALERSNAEVAIIARAGSNLSQYGLRYSHLAFVWRDDPHGRYSVVHLLNQCGSGRGALFDQGLGDFFMDDVYQYRGMIMIPDAAVQTRLATMLKDGGSQRFFEARYNMLAYPFATEYENSNQWALEVLAAALDQDERIDSRAAAQTWLRFSGYQPSVIHLSALQRLGAETTRLNVSFNDHPFDRRMAGLIDVVTVDSIERFLKRRQPDMTEILLQR